MGGRRIIHAKNGDDAKKVENSAGCNNYYVRLSCLRHVGMGWNRDHGSRSVYLFTLDPKMSRSYPSGEHLNGNLFHRAVILEMKLSAWNLQRVPGTIRICVLFYLKLNRRFNEINFNVRSRFSQSQYQ